MTTSLNLQSMPNLVLIEKFEKLVVLEKRTTAELIDYLKEVDRRRLYLDLGHSSLFSYLTKGLGYTPASAQRRIDSARLLQIVPEIKGDLRSGSLNLMQVAMVARSVRQKKKEQRDRVRQKQIGSTHANQSRLLEGSQIGRLAESSGCDSGSPCGSDAMDLRGIERVLLEKVKNQDLASTQNILAEALDLDLKPPETQRLQKDGSVHLELTLTKAQMEVLVRVKELLLHQNPNPTWAEVIARSAEEFIQRKDPLVTKPLKRKSTSKMEAAANHTQCDEVVTNSNSNVGQSRSAAKRRPIPMSTKRSVFQRDHYCQWRESKTGEKCGSRFQLQVDHRESVWAGGGNDEENLQLLCSVHNRLKYEREAGKRPTGKTV